MSKKYNRLWVFGDSYTTPNSCVSSEDSFWGLTAKHGNIPTIINCSRPGNSTNSITQLLVGMQEEYNWKTDLFLIGLSILERITVFDNQQDTSYIGNKFDTQTWTPTKFDIACHRGLVARQNYAKDHNLILYSDRSWTETQILRDIFLLTTWLDSKNANYMILNLSKALTSTNVWGPSNFVLPYCMNHSRCILFENTYQSINLNVNPPADFDQFGWDGHHGPAGNQYFFEKSLLPQMQKCNLI